MGTSEKLSEEQSRFTQVLVLEASYLIFRRKIYPFNFRDFCELI